MFNNEFKGGEEMVVTNRLYYLDHLRVVLTVLVLLHHTAITYGADGSWVIKDVETTDLTVTAIVLTLFTAINQSFFMGLFFFLSGYFTPASFDRKGAVLFLKDRVIRLGIPLLVYTLLIGPFIQYIVNFSGEMSILQFYKNEIISFHSINIGPLWFVEALLIFSVFYCVFRIFSLDKNQKQVLFPSGKALLSIAIGLGVTAFIIRLFWPTGKDVLGLQFGYFPSYILLFVAGILAFRNKWLDSISLKIVKRWRWISIIAIPVLPIVLIATGALDGKMNVSGGLNIQAFSYAIWEPFVCIGICLSLLISFNQWFNFSTKLWRNLSESAYTLFIIHPLVLVTLSLLLKGTGLEPFIKFLIVGVSGPVIGFVISNWICRLPGAKRVL